MAEKVTYDSLFSKDLDKQIASLNKELKTLSDTAKGLIDGAKKVKASNDNTGKSYNANKEKIKELSDIQKVYIEAEKEQAKIQKQLIALEAKKLTQANESLKSIEQERQALNENKQALRDLVKEEKFSKGSKGQLLLENKRLRKETLKLTDATEAERKELKRLNAQIDKNDANIEKFSDKLGKQKIGIGRYEKALQGARVGLSKLAGGIALAGGVIAAFTKFDAVIKQTTKVQNKLRFAFGTTGDELDKQTALVSTLANFYDEDFNAVIESANALSKEMGISGSESLALISDGFAKGANNTGEFLDILKEYPAQLRSVGLNAEQSIAIITQQVQTGIYSDKGIDAIKEAGLSLRENTKATQDALAPLAEGVRLQIQQDIAAGNTFKAIQRISKELSTANLTAEQTQKIISDVFKGAGEDAGLRYLQTLKDINTELDDIPDNLNDFEQASLNLTTQWSKFVTSVSSGEGVFGRVFGELKGFLGDVLRRVNVLSNLGFAGETQFIETFNESGGNAAKGIEILNSELTTLSSEMSRQVRLTGAQSDEVEDLREEYDQTREVLQEFYNQYFDGKDLTDEQLAIFQKYRIVLPEVAQATNELTGAIEDENKALDNETRAVKSKIPHVRELAEVELLTAKNIIVLNDELLHNNELIASTTNKTVFHTEQLKVNTDELLANMQATAASREAETEKAEELDRITKLRQRNEEITSAIISEGSNLSITASQAIADSHTEQLARQSEAEIEATQTAIDATNERIQSKESELQKEIERNEKGLNSNIARINAEIAAEKDKLAKEEKAQKAAFEQKKKRDKAAVLVNLGLELSALALAAAQNPLNGISLGAAGIAQLVASSAAAIIRSGLSIASIDAQNFAQGTEYVNGAGSETSDSIPANLSKGERVVPAFVNAQLNGIPNKDLPAIVNSGMQVLGLGDLSGKVGESNDLLGSINTNLTKSEGTTRTGQKIYRNGNVTVIR
jgi:hypothetical protein